MSALRNAVPQRSYRERDQPHSRARLGLLEKHKDYSARAKDYNIKKARLKALRQKASDRNEDEFHFGMMSSRTKDGIKVAERGNKALSNDVVKLLKTQDAGYLRTIRTRTMKERERLENQIQILDSSSPNEPSLRTLKGDGSSSKTGTHTVFVDNETEKESFSPENWFGTDELGISKTYNRPRRKGPAAVEHKQKLAKKESSVDDGREFLQSRQQAVAKLEAIRGRETQLLAAEQELEIQRAKMNHTAGGVNKHGVKFKVRQRKR